MNYLLGEMFNADAKAKLVHVPYRGAAPALQDLIGGQIDLVFATLPSVATHLCSSLRLIAVTSARRARSLSQIPAVAEAGFRDSDASPWVGLTALKKLTGEVLAKFNSDVNDLLRNKHVISQFEKQGAEPYVTSPGEFAGRLRADVMNWRELVKLSSARLD